MKIYTKFGDQGDTRLGDGSQTTKDNVWVDCYGNIDELNAVIGIVVALRPREDIAAILLEVQNKLFVLGAALSSSKLRAEIDSGNFSKEKMVLTGADVVALEKHIDRAEEQLKPLTSFIFPGGCPVGAQLHMARTVCRRAERKLIGVHKKHILPSVVLQYINRLSDLLFVLARLANRHTGQEEISW